MNFTTFTTCLLISTFSAVTISFACAGSIDDDVQKSAQPSLDLGANPDVRYRIISHKELSKKDKRRSPDHASYYDICEHHFTVQDPSGLTHERIELYHGINRCVGALTELVNDDQLKVYIVAGLVDKSKIDRPDAFWNGPWPGKLKLAYSDYPWD